MISTRHWLAIRVFMILVAFICLMFAATSAGAQTTRKVSTHPARDEASPAFNAYRGIHLGMTADEVRQKLGEPKDKGNEQDFFVFNDLETAQIVYDKNKLVVTISADFLSGATEILSPKQVFGTEVEAKADGSAYKMVRYPKAGYWLSFNRTGGAAPLTTVTIQKID